ncbi:hypothetical protein V6N13_059687 [Hibiscus sabdariffa]
MLVPLVSAGTALFPTIRRAGIQLEKQYFYTLFRIEEHLMSSKISIRRDLSGSGVSHDEGVTWGFNWLLFVPKDSKNRKKKKRSLFLVTDCIIRGLKLESGSC